MKLFVASLDNTKINFFFLVQGCSSDEVFVLLKGQDKLVQFSTQELTRVDTGQRKNKNNYNHSFKSRLDGQTRARPESQIGLIIDLDQCKDKNSHCHSFKTWIGSRSKARPRLKVGLTIDSDQRKD